MRCSKRNGNRQVKMKSQFILVEGISGSGKDKRVEDLSNFLTSNTSYKVHQFREPHYFREEIKALRRQPDFDKRRCFELFMKGRWKLSEQDMRPLLKEEGNLILNNRGYLSSLVIQQIEGFDLEYLVSRHTHYRKPELSLVLICDPEIAMERIRKRHEETGEPISPGENLEMLTRQRDLYLELGERFSNVKYVNTNGRPEAINLVMQSHVKNLLGMPMNKAIFFDKDATLVSDEGAPEVIPKGDIYSFSYNALAQAQNMGYKLFIVSSQPWVAKGRMSIQEVEDVFKSVLRKYSEKGVEFAGYGYCEHERDKNNLCPDKKPATRLIEKMIQEHNIDTTGSYMVGDLESDIIAGQNIGLKTIRVRTGNRKEEDHKVKSDYDIKNVGELMSVIPN